MLIADTAINTKIRTLKDLIQFLNRGEFEAVTEQLGEVFFSPEEFEPFASWQEHKYTRNCIARTADYELVLLCWQPQQATAIHCHDDKECWVKVVQGSFEEKMYCSAEKEVSDTGVRTLGQFEVTSATEATFLHSLKNTSNQRAMTLHLYMKPIEKCRVYNLDSKEMKVVYMKYDTIEGEVVD